MSALLRAELLKLRTTRTFVALVGIAAALALLVTVLTALLSEPRSDEEVRSFVIADTSGLFILLLGAIGMSGEWRHRTITSSVLASPDRVRLVLAKLVAYALAGMALSLVVNLLSMVIGTIILSARDLETLSLLQLADLLWRNLVLAALFGALGVAVGGLVRNQAVAVVALLVLSFVVEPAVIGLAPAVGRFGPFVAAPTAFTEGSSESFGDGGVDLLPPFVAILVLLAWIAALSAAAAAALQRRDLT